VWNHWTVVFRENILDRQRHVRAIEVVVKKQMFLEKLRSFSFALLLVDK
jgi:hypothetical protein